MYQKLAKIYLVGQVVLSVAVIILGISYCLRCLFDGQVFCAVCFAVIGYVSGYGLLFRASVKELRDYNVKRIKAKS